MGCSADELVGATYNDSSSAEKFVVGGSTPSLGQYGVNLQLHSFHIYDSADPNIIFYNNSNGSP